jgi:hypothetical protein
MTGAFTGTANSGIVDGTDVTGASITGSVIFNLSSLPEATVVGDTTTYASSGGPEWLTAIMTINLPTPVTLFFQRDPAGKRPDDAETAQGYVPVETQSAAFTRGLDLNGRCCDAATIGNANSGSWSSPSTGISMYYYSAFGLYFYQGLPAMLGDSGFPAAIDWSATNPGAIGSGWASSEIVSSGGVAPAGANSLTFTLESLRTVTPDSAVPEPGTALLAGAALVLVGGLRRRR